jgi:hypothetical protein
MKKSVQQGKKHFVGYFRDKKIMTSCTELSKSTHIDNIKVTEESNKIKSPD